VAKVLLVEDDDSMGIALKDGFEYEGYTVTLVRDGLAAVEAVQREKPDLMILDVMLPKESGLDVCKELRKQGSTLPIIMLTARSQEIDKVLGLKLGADDYVTKPFGFLELLARVEAVLRRSPAHRPAPQEYRFGDVTVFFLRNEAEKAGKTMELSARELRLLRYFIDHRGEVVSREQLLDAVWDYHTAPLTRTVDMHIAKLRKKIEDDPSDPRHIVTVHRAGYKFLG
jgi:two-component system alkaline phosphatase synthesis response regulator PhoP